MNLTLPLKNSLKLKKLNRLLNKSAKRALDLSLSSIALIVVSPVLAYTSYKIKKEDGGPILFKQNRSGLDNKTFEMYKFRSMKVDNKLIGTHSEAKENPYADWKGKVPDDFVFKSATGQNPNVTTIGAFIRKYSIDELPQLFNVLKGDMSLVGPRPEITQITSHYDSQQKRRLEVKPGITGWAQVNGRSDMNHGDKIKYDLIYVEKNSFFMDLVIIWKTMKQIIKADGAF